MEKKTTYEPLVANTAAKMERDTLIAKLGDSHKDFVANLSDDQVTALLGLSTPVANAEAPAPEAKPASEPAKDDAPVANSINDVVASAPAHLQAQLKDALVANERLRNSYVAVIVENKNNKFTKEELADFNMSQLERIAELATVPAVVTNAGAPASPKFAGSAGSPAPEVEAPLIPLSTAK